MAAISHSSTCLLAPKSSAARSRIGRMDSSLACIASSDSQEVVTMQRPDVRSTNRDKPTHPSMPSSAGITLSRVCAIPASMDEGCPWMVVLRAYMICLLCVRQRLDGDAVHFLVLPQLRRSNGRAGVSQGPSARTVIPTRSFESLECGLFQDNVGGPP